MSTSKLQSHQGVKKNYIKSNPQSYTEQKANASSDLLQQPE